MSDFGLILSHEFLRHRTGPHVENPGRLEAIEREIAPLLGRFQLLSVRRATDDELTSLHERALIERIESVAARGGGWLDGDTFCSPDTAEVARLAAGSCIDLARKVGAGELARGFALVRPPGHHATRDTAMGFCFYSNLALAARHSGVERVFIFDWDVHHGNGTEDCLYADGATCFCSFHQYPFYPGTGDMRARGEGAGAGLNCNLPLPAGMGDDDYLYAMDQIVDPLLARYDPDLILVSAGYDAHEKDPLGGMAVTTEGFRQIALRIASWSRRGRTRGRLVGLLEGGYDPGALARSVRATLEAWLDEGELREVPAQRVRTATVRRVAEAREVFGLD